MAINPVTGKVNNGGTPPIATGKKQQMENTGKIDSNPTPPQVDVTAITENIKQAFESANSTSVVNLDKVKEVKEALRNGQYQINAESIAEKMLELDRHLDST
ncbi:flagellar biosynthesis anti-sigma factor FlgM [Methylomarinum vadi]|uniref:flagellar biosynthesis anti-sigma factor FlgM n=1 Tax=Methylomarinum vadi TaxID=438855 RepID=UPI0004DF169B|nr:flagellar biosynthesis anti-sigma factor FlgM [Methylomarinum vadi]